MKESEIRQLFFEISNLYYFSYDDYKVALWQGLLENVGYEKAATNLKRYALDPANKLAPHPGILAETPTQRIAGPYVPNAEETRQLLAERERLTLEGPRVVPEFVKERMREIGLHRDNPTARES